MDISLQLSMLLWVYIWISLDFYGYPCIDLLWILDLRTSSKPFEMKGEGGAKWDEARWGAEVEARRSQARWDEVNHQDYDCMRSPMSTATRCVQNFSGLEKFASHLTGRPRQSGPCDSFISVSLRPFPLRALNCSKLEFLLSKKPLWWGQSAP